MTFLDVLIQLVNKRVQLLPLLGRKLKCIAGMNPLTQGAEIEERKMIIQAKIRPRAQSVRDERGTCLPCADALSVGSHQSKQGEETLGDKPLQYNHTFIYWSTPEDYSFLQHRGQRSGSATASPELVGIHCLKTHFLVTAAQKQHSGCRTKTSSQYAFLQRFLAIQSAWLEERFRGNFY